MYRFVHCADLHLDSPFLGLAADFPKQAKVLKEATFDVYERIVDLCISEKVDALLVAGDVFDSGNRINLKAEKKFVDGLHRLADNGIQAFVCHGNHDPLDQWQTNLTWPDSAYQFGDKPEGHALRKDDTDSPFVYGVSYPTREVRDNLIPRFPKRKTTHAAIGLLHANVGQDTGHEDYAPCTIANLVDTGYAYWALGHVHTRQVLRGVGDGAPVVVYPGNPQGRHINETGSRGVYIVEMDNIGVISEPKFIALDKVRWEILQIAIDDLQNIESLSDRLENQVTRLRDATEDLDVVYRVQLIGRGILHYDLIRGDLILQLQDILNAKFTTLEPFALCASMKLDTSSPIDRANLKRMGGFVSDLLDVIDSISADDTELQQLAEDANLTDLYQKGRAGRYLSNSIPNPSELKAFLKDAEQILLEGLVDDPAQQ